MKDIVVVVRLAGIVWIVWKDWKGTLNTEQFWNILQQSLHIHQKYENIVLFVDFHRLPTIPAGVQH